MTLTHAISPEPVTPPTSGLSEPSEDGEALGRDMGWDIVDEWGIQSFPASDPPSNW